MLTMFPGKRQWQRVVDAAAACEKRQRDEDEDDIVINDKTRLLSSESSENPSFDENLYYACTNVQDDDLPSQMTWKHDRGSIEPLFSSVELGDFDRFKHTQKAESACPVRKPCSHASWQGFKQLVKKQFMPPFPFGKDMPLEEMPHLRQRQIEGAMNKASRVLSASTNLGEIRTLDVKIQNSMNKFASTKGGKSKENVVWDHNQNLEISKAVKLGSLSETSSNVGVNAEAIKMKSSKCGEMPSILVKENGILRKLKRRMKKEHVLLLANARD